ncbi:MAG: ABC transporter permease subunit [Candidatus Woesearchaeota archaeon]|jgi:ABC-type transport system involved in multi-copper enzyme maturation permease subunit|nr:ABC transporter permease subunit [Candidatus Woesearchaeota archaeon]
MSFHQFKTILVDDIKESFKDKRILAVIVIYLIILSWGMKKAIAFSGVWNFWLTEMVGLGKQLPFSVIFFYFASIALLPILSLLLSYDIISGERRTLRNIIYRCPRISLFFGKFIAIFLINVVINLIIYIIAIDYLSNQSSKSFLSEGLLLYIFLVCFALYFTSLVTMASTLTKSPRKSLFLGALFIFIPLLFLFSNTIKILSPFHYYKYGMLFFSESVSPAPFVLLIISSAIFLGLAYYVFRRQDL